MLSSAQRLRHTSDFSLAVRRGRRATSSTLVVHVLATGSGTSAQVGFVVSKVVGNAVVRNRVKRRLRHLMRERLEAVPRGARVVVRASPAAATAEFTSLATDLDTCLAKAVDGRSEP